MPFGPPSLLNTPGKTYILDASSQGQDVAYLCPGRHTYMSSAQSQGPGSLLWGFKKVPQWAQQGCGAPAMPMIPVEGGGRFQLWGSGSWGAQAGEDVKEPGPEPAQAQCGPG